MYKKKYQEPSYSEGFKEIVEIDWNPNFENQDSEKMFLERS